MGKTAMDMSKRGLLEGIGGLNPSPSAKREERSLFKGFSLICFGWYYVHIMYSYGFYSLHLQGEKGS